MALHLDTGSPVAAEPPAGRARLGRLLADCLSLTKPGVVSLLVLTEIAAMVMAARGWPGWRLVLLCALAGACAAGGASAVNCWFDRDIDAVMERTRRRPLPAGRLSPAAALGLGLALTAVSLLLFWTQANGLTALLSLAGGAFYVLVYTVWLKRSTSQNIVIGGAAGAVPPLVGWAAVTGAIAPPALVLFALIFAWTPPHFWSLSLLLKRDYGRAGVPMRPVVSGERGTRRAILLYSAAMVAVSLVPILWLGQAYLAGSAVLGTAFLALAFITLREQGRRWARRLYLFSLLYLALLLGLGAASAALAGGPIA